MPTSLSISIKFEDLRARMAFLIKHGLGAEVNLYDASKIFLRDEKESAELGDLFAQNKIHVSAHLPFMDLNLGSLDQRVREYSQKCLHWGMDIGLALGAKLFVCHTGFWPLIPRKDYPQWLINFSEGFTPLVQRAKTAKVQIAVENTWEHDDEILSEIFKRFPEPEIGYCLDLGHANCFAKIDAFEWLRRLGKRLIHIHLHDNSGHNDDHGPLGSGTVPVGEFFRQLTAQGISPSVNLEASPGDVEHNLQYLEKLLHGDGSRIFQPRS